VKETVNIPSSF